MPYQNIQATLSDPDIAAIMQKIDEAAALMPFLVNLTAAEKKRSLNLGRKSEKFFLDIQKVIYSNPAYKPAYVNNTDLDNDLTLFVQLMYIETKLRALLEGVSDTRVALAQEIMKPALAVYSNVKQAALAQVPGSDAVLNDLKPYFKKSKRKKS